MEYDHRFDKFDRQLREGHANERRMMEMLGGSKIELKSESWQWEQTGNICIEYEQAGKPSGIAITEAEIWVHELKRDGRTLMYLFIPVERLKELCREAFRKGRVRSNCGDGGRTKVVLLRVRDLIS